MTNIDPKVIRQLIKASEAASDALGDVLNAEYGAGNDEHEDVQHIAVVLDELDAVLKQVVDKTTT